MASNSRISLHRRNGGLCLKLIGDFDGTSACKLLNVLEENCHGPTKVLVNTSGLKDVYPFGVDTLHNSLYLLKDRPIRLAFTGDNATVIAPERNKFF